MWATPDRLTRCPVRLYKAKTSNWDVCSFLPSSQPSLQADVLLVQKATMYLSVLLYSIESWRHWLIRAQLKVKRLIIQQGRQWFKLCVQQMSLIPQLCRCLDTRVSPASITTRSHHWISRGWCWICSATSRLMLVRVVHCDKFTLNCSTPGLLSNATFNGCTVNMHVNTPSSQLFTAAKQAPTNASKCPRIELKTWNYHLAHWS